MKGPEDMASLKIKTLAEFSKVKLILNDYAKSLTSGPKSRSRKESVYSIISMIEKFESDVFPD